MRAVSLPVPPVLPTERIAHLGTADCCIHPPGRNEMIAITPPIISSKEVAQKQATPLTAPARPSAPELVLRQISGDGAGWIFDFRAPSPQGPLAHAGTRGIPSDGRRRAGPLICLGRASDACVVGALERVGDTLYGARVYVELGRRLAHAHAARQGRPDRSVSLSFTLGPL